MNVIEAISDANLFGGFCEFRDLSTWGPWLVFLKSTYGMVLDEDEQKVFCEHTGRTEYDPPKGGWPEVVAVVGRQSGKTRISSLIVAYEAATTSRDDTRSGELYALLVSQDARASQRASLSYTRVLLDSSKLLRGAIQNETANTIDLNSGVRIAAYPCRPAAIRGLRARVVLLDELAFFRSSEGFDCGREMLRAARPALATTGGKLIAISSPYAQSGVLWELHRKYHGSDSPHTLVWQASAPVMNPTLPADYLARMELDDPAAYRSEVLGEFRTGISTLLDPDAIQACVASDRLELPPVTGITYEGFADPSGGRKDAFTLAIGHRDGERGVVDVLRAWRAPFNPSSVTAEASTLLREYGCRQVTGDRFAGEWPREAFRSNGIRYELSRATRSELYLAFCSTINSAQVEIPDDTTLLRELRGLERRRGPSGRDRVDHVPGAHDDSANAVAGLADLIVGRPRVATMTVRELRV